MSLSPSQLDQRRGGITATDAAAIAGVHPYRSAIDVWLEKTGQAPAFVGNDRTKWGNLLEPVIRADYAERRGFRVEVPGTIDHARITWRKATPDGVCYVPGRAQPDRGLEIKCHTINLAHLYGAPGTDEVPGHELVQCQWNMDVTDLGLWDLVAFLDGQTNDYTIQRDTELIDMLAERCERFLVDNVQGGVVPEPDGSDGYDRFLTALHRKHGGEIVEADPHALADVAKLRALREQIAALESEEDVVVQALKAAIGDNAGLGWPIAGGKREQVTWKQTADSIGQDFRGAFASLREQAALLTSATESTVDGALAVLRAINGYKIEGGGGMVTAVGLIEIIDGMRNAMAAIANATPNSIVTKQGGRRFTVPRSWKNNSSKEA